MLIGVIADDFTGASDIAITLAKGLPGEGGLKTAQYLGVPQQAASAEIEAGVIALKSRSIAASEAVATSLAACQWLLDQGCKQIVFKYCSTFDSTAAGNIGPVADALAALLQQSAVVVCPAFPTMGRTLYQGHLFVHHQPLNESGMENHPLTPMKDADIRRVLAVQSVNKIGHIAWQQVAAGPQSLIDALAASALRGERLTVVDALDDQDLVTIGRACDGVRLLTGGSAIAQGLAHNFIARGEATGSAVAVPHIDGPEAILVGSCSNTTRKQIAIHARQHPVLMIAVDDVLAARVTSETLVAFILGHGGEAPLVYSSGDTAAVMAAQQQYGQMQVSQALDNLFADTARKLVAAGVRRIVVGGGETSGAVVSALDLGALTIGPEIDTGVPVLVSSGAQPIALALKSGNFGGEDFFARAVKTLRGD
jgi:uncharacterized protein YgbK (DUF1537 family)